MVTWMKSNYTASESAEQITVMRWAEWMSNRDPRYSLLFHIPNGGSRHPAEAARFKAEGVRAGVPDLMLPVAVEPFHGMFLELKRTKGGRVSADQRRWIDQLRAQGYYAAVAFGAEDAIAIIKLYMEAGIK